MDWFDLFFIVWVVRFHHGGEEMGMVVVVVERVVVVVTRCARAPKE